MSQSEYPRVGLLTDSGNTKKAPLDSVQDVALPYGRLLLLADGVGDGSRPTAAEVALDALSRFFLENRPDFEKAHSVPKFIHRAIQDANREVIKAAASTGSAADYSASVVVALLIDNSVYVGYCGSARMVVIRGGTPTRITRDYSNVGAGADADQPGGSAVTRIAKPLGLDQELSPAVFAGPVPLKEGDAFVLCADGLYEGVTDGEMADVVSSSQAEDAVSQLKELARKRGSTDDLSIVVFQTDVPILEAEVLESTAGESTAAVTPKTSKATKAIMLWTVIACSALVLVTGLLIWSPWSTSGSHNEEAATPLPSTQTEEQAAQSDDVETASATEKGWNLLERADENNAQPETAEPTAQDKTPESGEAAVDDYPGPGGKVIAVQPPIPMERGLEKPKGYVKKGRKIDGSELEIQPAGSEKADSAPEEATSGKTPEETGTKPGSSVLDPEVDKALALAEQNQRGATDTLKTPEQKTEATVTKPSDQKPAQDTGSSKPTTAVNDKIKTKSGNVQTTKPKDESLDQIIGQKDDSKNKSSGKDKTDAKNKATDTTSKPSGTPASCNIKDANKTDAKWITKINESVAESRKALKENNGMSAAAHYKNAKKLLGKSEAVKQRCGALVEQNRAEVVKEYLRLASYLDTKKQCPAARNRANDARSFGATESDIKKALPKCGLK